MKKTEKRKNTLAVIFAAAVAVIFSVSVIKSLSETEKNPFSNEIFTQTTTVADTEAVTEPTTAQPVTEGKKTKKFFDNIIETLTGVYGQENEKTEKDSGVTVGYKWNGKSTMLQVDKMDSSVIISVGLVEVE